MQVRTRILTSLTNCLGKAGRAWRPASRALHQLRRSLIPRPAQRQFGSRRSAYELIRGCYYSIAAYTIDGHVFPEVRKYWVRNTWLTVSGRSRASRSPASTPTRSLVAGRSKPVIPKTALRHAHHSDYATIAAVQPLGPHDNRLDADTPHDRSVAQPLVSRFRNPSDSKGSVAKSLDGGENVFDGFGPENGLRSALWRSMNARMSSSSCRVER